MLIISCKLECLSYFLSDFTVLRQILGLMEVWAHYTDSHFKI